MVILNDENKSLREKLMITKYELPFYRISDLANSYPLMNNEERAELKQSILTIGQQNPIVLYKNEIIDGRNRYLVLKDLADSRGYLKFEPKFEKFQGDEANLPNIIEALNLHRRHLTQSQKAAIGVKNHLETQRKLAKERQEQGVSLKTSEHGKTAEAIAKIVGVNTTYVEKAIKVNKDKQLFSFVEDGKISVVDAEIITSHATVEQRDNIIQMLKNNITLGLKYHITLIKPKKKKKEVTTINEKTEINEVDFKPPAMIIIQTLQLEDEKAKLIKQKIQELNELLKSVNKKEDSQIWYESNIKLNNEIIETLKKWNLPQFRSNE